MNYNNIVPIFLAIDGAALMTIWTIDIYNKKLLKDGFFKSQEAGTLFWPHLIAEYATATGLLISAYGLYNDRHWAQSVTLVSLGALSYTSLSSLGWTFSEKKRYVYAIPMILSLIGAGISITVIF